jgi:hypothetical protein
LDVGAGAAEGRREAVGDRMASDTVEGAHLGALKEA